MAPRGRSAAPGLPQNNRLEIGDSLLYWGCHSVHRRIGYRVFRFGDCRAVVCLLCIDDIRILVSLLAFKGGQP